MSTFAGRNLLRGDSPLSSGDSPKQTPQSSPPPPNGGVATGIHQVYYTEFVIELHNGILYRFRKMLAVLLIFIPPQPITHPVR